MKKIIILLLFLFSMQTYATDVNFNENSITTMQAAIKSGDITCEGIITAYLNRIKAYNLSTANSAPVNAFTTLNTEALEQARSLDVDFAATHQLKGSLHCVPVVVKDNMDTYDMTATSGSLAMLGNQPVKDAFLVNRIRDAGGIIIGKGAMDEFAAGLTGISSRSGRIGNAFDQQYNSGGSSGGSAVAVALNFALVGVGSDNSGSVRIPATFNGMVGLRPSMGLISQQGIFPRGNIDGTAGPIARDVHDLAVLLDVIAKEDTQDKKTQGIPRPASYLSFLQSEGLKGKRIGLVRLVNKKNVHKNQTEELTSLLKDMQTVMQQQGATLVPNVVLPDFDTNRKSNEAGEYEDINDYLSAYPAVRKNYDDICESNRTRTFGKDVEACLQFIHAMPKREGNRYHEVMQMIKHNQEVVEKVMADNHLDALLMPISKTGMATYQVEELNPITLSSNAGLPAITLNIGYSKEKHLPIGVELTGKKYSEGELIAIAYAYEQHSQPRIMPTLPEINHKYSSFPLAKLNNAFSRIGEAAYLAVLQKGKSSDLTAEKFRAIVEKTME